MKQEIGVIFLEEAEKYFTDLPHKIQDKFTISFYKTKSGFKGEWFEKLKGSKGVFEFRQRDSEKFYRLFAFWDKESDTKSLIVGTHGFNKKTNKTPKKEILKAELIKANYFKTKK